MSIPDTHLSTYLKAFWDDWLSRMCGPLSVPFGPIAVWWAHAPSAKVLWAGLAVLAFFLASYRVWRNERDSGAKEIEKLRQLSWSKEPERFLALEERAGQLVEELASHRALAQSIVGPRLEEFRQDAGRFARHDDVRRAILQLQNALDRMFVAKRDHGDDDEGLRSELYDDLKKLLNACDHERDKLQHGRI